MRRITFFSISVCTGILSILLQPAIAQEKTAFQIAAPWNEAYDVRSDVAIVWY